MESKLLFQYPNRNMKTVVFIAVFCTCFINSIQNPEDLNIILSNVEKIEGVSGPGVITSYGEACFPISVGLDDDVRKPFISAIRYGQGKVVLYAHTNYMFSGSTGFDNNQLLLNIVNWVGNTNPSKAALYVYEDDETNLANWLPEFGIMTTVLQPSQLGNFTFLRQFDVIFINNPDNWLPELEEGSLALVDFIVSGGGLILGATPWSHTPPAGQIFRNSFWANKIIGNMGTLFVEGATYQNIPNGFNASQEMLINTHSGKVWEDLKILLQKGIAEANSSEWRQMFNVFRDRIKYAPADQTINSEISREFLRLPSVVPTKPEPVSLESDKKYLLAHRYLSEFLNMLNMSSVINQHPSAVYFPGIVPPEENDQTSSSTVTIEINSHYPKWAASLNAQQLEKYIPTRINTCHKGNKLLSESKDIIDIDTVLSGWHSTGLYAKAGELINVEVLNAPAVPSGFEIQIGVHTDDIQRLSNWSRCPKIVYKQPFSNSTADIVSPFGGLILINIPTATNESYTVNITGGVLSPTFMLGKTSLQQWRNEIRYYSAPWGELVGNNFIISAKKENLQNLDNPEDLIVLWDHILDAIADLAAIPRHRVRPERLVADVQISAGYLHSGYPIMGYPEHEEDAINITRIKFDSSYLWGHFHELGHNHQKSDWTFSGTGEVTCNLFALYVMHNVCGFPTNMSHPELSDSDIRTKLQNYISNGKIFEDWQSRPWTALITYIQLQETFGWGAYKRVFANYFELSDDERPQTDQDKIDLWMIMFSNVAEENLTPFFRSWGFPITDEAEREVLHLRETTLRIPIP